MVCLTKLRIKRDNHENENQNVYRGQKINLNVWFWHSTCSFHPLDTDSNVKKITMPPNFRVRTSKKIPSPILQPSRNLNAHSPKKFTINSSHSFPLPLHHKSIQWNRTTLPRHSHMQYPHTSSAEELYWVSIHILQNSSTHMVDTSN